MLERCTKSSGELEDGLAQANAVPYGLAAYVFTADLQLADAVVAGWMRA
ncbi:hypothetical protein AB0F43_34265 [Kribbella sp. NPDC023972]